MQYFHWRSIFKLFPMIDNCRYLVLLIWHIVSRRKTFFPIWLDRNISNLVLEICHLPTWLRGNLGCVALITGKCCQKTVASQLSTLYTMLLAPKWVPSWWQRRMMHVINFPKTIYPDDFISQTLYIPKLYIPKLYIPKHLYPKTFISQNIYNPKYLYPKTFITQNIYVPKHLYPKLNITQKLYIPNILYPKFL